MRTQQRQNKRPTIGLLCNELNSEFIAQMVWSAADTAQKAGANLLCFAGGALRDAQGRLLQSNVLYDLVSQYSVDGLLILSNFMGTFVSQDEMISKVFGPYQPIPTISIGLTVSPYPAILVDNYAGMYAAVTHLIEEHGYQHIAFVRGPHGHEEANIRFQAYQDALAHHSLPLDPALVVTGDFLPLSGEEATSTLLDERHIHCRAIVAANDLMAFGVLKVLKERQLHVPHDMAVVGFDDADSARYSLPPLTTVRQPISEMGQSIVNVMLSMLSGEEPPRQIKLPTELVVRQSCGCVNPTIAQALIGLPGLAGQHHDALDSQQRQNILENMQRALGKDVQPNELVWLNQLLDTFVIDLDARKQGSFLATLDEILQQINEAGRSPAAWGNTLSAMRRSLFPLLPENQILLAEDSWLPARMMVYEMAQQSQHYYTSQLGQQMRRVTTLQGSLITTFDLQQIVDTLIRELLRLGIPSCSLSLYENPRLPATTSRLLLAYTEKFKRFTLPEEQQIFSSKQLAPAGYFPDHSYCIVAEPLHFGEENLGFALFEVGPRQGNIYETLRGSISSTLQAAMLIQRVRERSAELTRQQYILSTFMENVPDHIYFKDLQSRITRANRAHAINLQFSDPVEEIGKSDFDFFPEGQARVKYDQEQEIIRTGQPILNWEEPDGSGGWVLTTKMPLRDEHGHIIGTFGISRDITELKQAQAALEQA
jgi:PAS domain S-box-containing protein